jgi:phage tail-like protein
MSQPESAYLRYLPTEYSRYALIGQFLAAFERMLSTGSDDAPAIEQVIDGIDRYVRPLDPDPRRRAPDEFLPWLAGWVSLTLRDDWDDETKRRFVRGIVPLYSRRGTRDGLREMLRLYLGETTKVDIFDDMRPGEFGAEPPPFFFQVRITTTNISPEELQLKQRIATAIIDQEKPAHTYYALQFLLPSMRLVSQELHERIGAPRLILGKGGNTLLGTEHSA